MFLRSFELSKSPGGEIGRRGRLKICFPKGVRVRVPSRAPYVHHMLEENFLTKKTEFVTKQTNTKIFEEVTMQFDMIDKLNEEEKKILFEYYRKIKFMRNLLRSYAKEENVHVLKDLSTKIHHEGFEISKLYKSLSSNSKFFDVGIPISDLPKGNTNSIPFPSSSEDRLAVEEWEFLYHCWTLYFEKSFPFFRNFILN